MSKLAEQNLEQQQLQYALKEYIEASEKFRKVFKRVINKITNTYK